MTDWPKIKSRRIIDVSQWMELIEREVEFAPGRAPELYHAVGQADYVAIVARAADGRLLIVRQFRPALEQFIWELPAGMVEKGEDAAQCARRELLEETGFRALTVHELGNYSPCTARLSNRVHTFFVETAAAPDAAPAESGIESRLVTPAELSRLIGSGEFGLQLHVGAIMLAGLAGHLDLAAFRLPSQP
jgi:ADP-ribose pyrophosphatase